MKKAKIRKNFKRIKAQNEKTLLFYLSKIFTVALCIAACALFIVSVEASQVKERSAVTDYPQINVYAANRRILEDQTPLIDSVTYVPLRAYSEIMGAESVEWNAKTRTATVKKDETQIKITDGTSFVDASGRIFFCPTGIRNIGDRLYVPIRALSSALSLDVEWDGDTRSVLISESQIPFVSGDKFYNSDDLYWLSRIIHAEAQGEPFLGKIAVGNVVINRKRSPSYPNSIYGVIFDRKHGTQFSPVSMGTIYNTPSAESVLAAKICLEGYSLDSEILFFVNPRYATSTWIERTRPYSFTIGGHKFYR